MHHITQCEYPACDDDDGNNQPLHDLPQYALAHFGSPITTSKRFGNRFAFQGAATRFWESLVSCTIDVRRVGIVSDLEQACFHKVRIMNSLSPIDQFPYWGVLGFILVTTFLSMELGYRLGSWRHHRITGEKESPVAAMVGSMLGLLAFLLAFTFGLAASRFDERRRAILDEANAIGTTFLRTDFLPDPHSKDAKKLLREYVALRCLAPNPENIATLIRDSERLHGELWRHAAASVKTDVHSVAAVSFVESLNETIDLHGKRVFAGLRSRIPITVWIALWILTFFGMISVGYQTGLAGAKRSPEMIILNLAFTIVLMLIVDLDRAHEGFLRVGQQSMVDVAAMMDTSLNRASESP